MTKLARTRVHARKGGQSWSTAMPEDGQAPRVMIRTILTPHPAYLHSPSTQRRHACTAFRKAGCDVEILQIMTLGACPSLEAFHDGMLADTAKRLHLTEGRLGPLNAQSVHSRIADNPLRRARVVKPDVMANHDDARYSNPQGESQDEQ